MIDLHCHILPGLDDGPSNLDFSVALARAAVASGTNVTVATPHLRHDHRVEPEQVAHGVEVLNAALEERGIELLVVAGAEVSLGKATELDDDVLATVCLGRSRYVLVESPYRRNAPPPEPVLDDLRRRGFRPVLAHPERCPIFQREPDRLADQVRDGTLCSITAGSLDGHFGEPVRRFGISLLAAGLVHSIASDAHDHVQRPPGLTTGIEAAERELPGLAEQSSWFTVTAPVAILSDRPLPPAPPPLRPVSSLRRWLHRAPR